MVPELPRQHISASNATGYQVQLATSYFWTGVPQGSILGPLLFLAYIDDIPQCIQHHSKIAIFADDSKLYQIISKPSDKILFQQDLTQLSNWSHTWAMSLSIPKCKTLIISRKKSRPSREYHLQSQPKVSGHPQTKALPRFPSFNVATMMSTFLSIFF